MNAPGREAALARLEVRRHQIEGELARVERQIVRAVRQVLAFEQRIVSRTKSQQRAA